MERFGRFFIRWTPAPGQGGYVTKGQPNRKPYCQHPSEAQNWASRKSAERFLSRKDALWASHCTIVEAPSTWLARDPRTPAEWDAQAAFLGIESGASLQEQVRLADEILTEIFAEEEAANAS